MAYLISKDYLRNIQTSELTSLTAGDSSIRVLVEGSVEREIRSYLIQKYDLAEEFKNTQLFSMAVSYKGGNRVYIDATAYSATSTYAIGALALQTGSIYRCTTTIGAAEAFNISKWTLVGSQYDLFYVQYPKPVFDQLKYYLKGDQIFWKDKTYTAQRNSTSRSHEGDLQALSLENISAGNVFPDDTNTSAAISMWGNGTSYSVAAATPPTDTTKWTKGDNRNQFFVSIYMDMVIYELCKRIAPNNVPEARHNAWLRAVQVLKDFAKGNITAELPVIQPRQGSPINYGGKVRQENSW